jgi:hypothetical protein
MFIELISMVYCTLCVMYYTQIIKKLHIQFMTRSTDDLFLLYDITKTSPDEITRAVNALHKTMKCCM